MTEERQSRADVSVYDLIAFGKDNFALVVIIALSFSAIAIGYGLLKDPVYRAESIVAPVKSTGSLPGIPDSLSGIAGLAGMAGLRRVDSDLRAQSLAILKSRAFTEWFIVEHDLLPILFEEQWDSEDAKWRDGISEVPTIRNAFIRFDEEVRSIYEDRDRGLITITIEWTDRYLAAEWANALVSEVNARIRMSEIAEAERSLKFLRDELDKWRVIELQQVVFKLIEKQLSRIMFANTTEEYAFRIIDPAVVPDSDQYVWPRVSLLALVGFFLGAFLGFLVAMIRLLARDSS